MTTTTSSGGQSPLPKKYAAGILLVTRDSPRQFLLMRHPDRWDLPKGHRDGNETDLETALRETEEETGILAQQIQIDPVFRHEVSYRVEYKKRNPDQVFQKHLVYFLGEIETAVAPVLTEHESYRWFPWSPPHQIQAETIDPLLNALAEHWG